MKRDDLSRSLVAFDQNMVGGLVPGREPTIVKEAEARPG
jgi:hypothetical protein